MLCQRGPRSQSGRDSVAIFAHFLIRRQNGPQPALELVDRDSAVAVRVQDTEDGRGEAVAAVAFVAAASHALLERSSKLDDAQALLLVPLLPLVLLPDGDAAQKSEEHGYVRIPLEFREGEQVLEGEQARVTGQAVEAVF